MRIFPQVFYVTDKQMQDMVNVDGYYVYGCFRFCPHCKSPEIFLVYNINIVKRLYVFCHELLHFFFKKANIEFLDIPLEIFNDGIMEYFF